MGDISSQIIKEIFGNYSFIQLFGFSWFLMIGYVIYALNETTLRDVNSIRTPIKWSWKFWYKDNWKRYLVTILSTYILFRFYVQFVGNPLTDFEALMIGLVGDGIGATAKRRILIATINKKTSNDQQYNNAINLKKSELNNQEQFSDSHHEEFNNNENIK